MKPYPTKRPEAPRASAQCAPGARAAATAVGGLAAAGVLLAGCSGNPPAPSEAEVEAISIPSPRSTPNASSSSGACGLLTDGEIEQATGAAIDRTSALVRGCVWQESGAGGVQPVIDISVKGDIDGAISRVYDEVLAGQQQSGDTRRIDGLGDRAFTTVSGAPAVWWTQSGHVYGLSVLLPPSQIHGDASTVALDLARLASSRIEG